MKVRRRHVIYVQGYDPRGLAQYYRLFRTELRKFAALYGVTATITRPFGAPGDSISSWRIETSAPDWQTSVIYDFLRVEDLIKNDMAWPIWRKALHGLAIHAMLLVQGTMLRFWRAHWRFAAFITYPHVMLIGEAVASALLAFVIGAMLSWTGLPTALCVLVGLAVFLAAWWALLRFTERWTYVLYLTCDTIFTWQFAHGQRPEWDERLDHFARHLVEVARTSDADEIVVVGHSSGSFFATEVVARALERDPGLGRHGPRVVLFTVGGSLPIVGFHAKAQWFRTHLAELAVAPAIDWMDFQSRKDVMNFFQFDPVAAHGIEPGPAQRNPIILLVRFKNLIRPEHYRLFRSRFFRVHFQFVMANERADAYDFFMIACGPVPLRERVDWPAEAVAIVTGTGEQQQCAWDAIAAGGTVAKRMRKYWSLAPQPGRDPDEDRFGR